MKTNRLSSVRFLRVMLALAGLISGLVAVGCTLNAEGWEAVEPQAEVQISPTTFCVGETLTASWDGGPQVGGCGSPPNLDDCKGASLSVIPFTPGLMVGGFDDYSLSGSASAMADYFYTYTANYTVQWNTWASYRSYRELDVNGEWIGIVRAQAEAVPLGDYDYMNVNYADTFVCDEVTHTWVMGRSERGAGVSSGDADHLGDPDFQRPPNGDLSACAVITGEVCIPLGWTYSEGVDRLGRLQVSVPGGPSVTLGVPGNPDGLPSCTDAFIGYHPEDIVIDPLDVRTLTQNLPPQSWTLGDPCTPGEDTFFGYTYLNYQIGGSTLCAVSTTPSSSPVNWSGGGFEPFQFGSVQPVGVSLDRCRAALDPAFLAAYDAQFGAIPPGAGGTGTSFGCGTPCNPDFPNCDPGLSCLYSGVGNSYYCTGGVDASGFDCSLPPGAGGVPDQPTPTAQPGGPSCGNGVCDPGEHVYNCPVDCGQPPPPATQDPCASAYCGNGVCEYACGETSSNCGDCFY